MDINFMSFLYPQPDWVFVQKDFPGTLGGSFLFPFADFATGETNVPSGGTLWVLTPGIYTATGTHSKPMTIQAPLGGVVLK